MSCSHTLSTFAKQCSALENLQNNKNVAHSIYDFATEPTSTFFSTGGPSLQGFSRTGASNHIFFPNFLLYDNVQRGEIRTVIQYCPDLYTRFNMTMWQEQRFKRDNVLHDVTRTQSMAPTSFIPQPSWKEDTCDTLTGRVSALE